MWRSEGSEQTGLRDQSSASVEKKVSPGGRCRTVTLGSNGNQAPVGGRSTILLGGTDTQTDGGPTARGWDNDMGGGGVGGVGKASNGPYLSCPPPRGKEGEGGAVGSRKMPLKTEESVMRSDP